MWDYSSPAAYFVTICTKDRRCFFGEIKNGEMKYSPLGNIARRCWMEIPDHFSVDLDVFQVMPNHVHGIVVIRDDDITLDRDVHDCDGRDVQLNVSTAPNRMSAISPKVGSLGVIVRTFKAAVTTIARSIDHYDFAWQPRYYDRIIGTERAFKKIQEYIVNNVAISLERPDCNEYRT